MFQVLPWACAISVSLACEKGRLKAAILEFITAVSNSFRLKGY